MNGAEKDKMVDGSGIRRLTEEYRSKNQPQNSPEKTLSTPKRRRYDDNDNDIQEIEDNDNFQTVGKRNRKKTRTSINPNDHNTLEDNLDQAPSKGYQGQKVNEKRNNIRRIIFNSQSQNGKKINEQRRGEEINETLGKRDKINNTQQQTGEISLHSHSNYNITQHALQYAEEVVKILNSGVFPLNGYLIEVTEFLAPPKLLICSRCNCPGHIKKECNGPFDRCKRCGVNKAQGDHSQCLIKCHHCEGDHIASDYRCPVITKFRGELIDELRKRPDLLPQNIQLFIPVEFRNGGKNYIGYQQKENIASQSQSYLPSSHINVWPSLKQSTQQNYVNESKPDIYEDIMKEIKSIRSDYEKLKFDFIQSEKELMIKYENNKSKSSTMLNLLMLQNTQQNDCISKVYTVVNEVVPIITSSLKSLHTFIEKIVKSTEDVNLKNEYNIIQFTIEQNLAMLNDRNDLIIEHQRATTMLNEKTNDIFRHGFDLMSINEQ
ncbi:unnamed protein product [Rotaria magnacalcarata]|uniref:CCHC-type domain-containing protein n=1 Tax=Rotaria magnacalcarata TaxID=392030 RepID=A0A816VLY0_9BILA|nr:unnamed protein product [Rotaria magnacalcarata]